MDESEDKSLTKKEKRALAREEKRKARESSERSSKMKKWGGIALLLAFVGILGYFFVDWLKTPTPEDAGITIETVENDWIKGSPDAQVTLIEYADFQCPACANYVSPVSQLLEENPESFRAVFRHMPLTSIHRNALSASMAAEAAGIQGSFWEMHDMLFEKQEDWSEEGGPEEKYVQYAKELGLDETAFVEGLDSDEIKSRVNASSASGNSLGVTSTPTFFLNGKRMVIVSTEQFKTDVEDEIRGYTVLE